MLATRGVAWFDLDQHERYAVHGNKKSDNKDRQVRNGSIASLCSSADYFRSPPENGHRQGRSPYKGAISRHDRSTPGGIIAQSAKPLYDQEMGRRRYSIGP